METTQFQDSNNVKLEPQWKEQLLQEFQKDYMISLKAFLKTEYDKKKTIYPPASLYFEAFNQTPFHNVKVVILGQDPYHGPGQAHGLCFSVNPGVRFPPSLNNIFKELNTDIDTDIPQSGCLNGWAKQGVLLLNATLTVENGKAGSHQGKGWEEFTDQVLRRLNEREQPMAFVLWGSFAQKKAHFIDQSKHLVLKSPHPSPLSAHRGFFGTKPFSKVNEFLESKGMDTIDWSKTN